MPPRLLPPTRWLTHAASAPPVTTTTDFMTPTPSRLLGILLADLWAGQVVPAAPAASAALPRGHHLAYFRSEAAPSALLADGTSAAHAGAGAGPRVWAGGAVRFVGGVALDGGAARCHEQVARPRRRGGADFVDVWRRYGLAGAADDRVIERCTLRLDTGRSTAAVTTAAATAVAADARIVVTPLRAHLFAMSALSYNAHTIHLDPSRLAADAPLRLTPGQPALLVQGSLMLALALSLAESSLPSVSAIQYRCLAPLYCDEPMAVCLRRSRSPTSTSLVWIERPDGCLAFSADIFAAEAMDESRDMLR